jgi:sec-independent protein translocase protein TatB
MLDLSPVKLLLVFIVAVILLGPDKLPQVARQLGAGWRKLRNFHEQMDREIRQNIPDLPSSQDIARFARSPVALLNQLAEMPSRGGDELVEDPGAAPVVAEAAWPEDPSATGPERSTPVDRLETPGGGTAVVLPPEPDDPSMN